MYGSLASIGFADKSGRLIIQSVSFAEQGDQSGSFRMGLSTDGSDPIGKISLPYCAHEVIQTRVRGGADNGNLDRRIQIKIQSPERKAECRWIPANLIGH